MSSHLFSPYALRELRLANRIVVSPMCMYSAEDGSATDWHLMHLGAMTQSAAGLMFIEATAVNAVGRITPGCLGLYSDANEEALRRVLDAVRPHANTPIGMQLAHAGRKGSSARPWEGGALLPESEGGWKPLAPSAIAHKPGEAPPRAMTRDEIARTVDDFAAAARRAARLGLEALELHAAHGYLLHQFLSPISNRRDDEYGGSFGNRIRLLLEVFAAVRVEWPAQRPLGVRVSASDWLEYTGESSWTLEDTIALAEALGERGCDWIDVSSGGVSPAQKIALGPGYQVPFAARLKQALPRMSTMAVGLITEPAQAEAIVAGGEADLVAMARAFLWNPRWAWHAAAQLGGELPLPPPQYGRAAPREHAKLFAKVPLGMR